MKKTLGIFMDPIASIHYKKDTTLAMLWEAEKRGWEILYFEQKDMFFHNGDVKAHTKKLKVFHNEKKWFEFLDTQTTLLKTLDMILLRKDPPFDLEYLYATQLLELVEQQGVFILNKPSSVRDVNEKLFTIWFSQCCPPNLITKDTRLLKQFLQEQNDIVCKPLHAMGGESIFRLTYPDENASVIFEVLTKNETATVMAQRYIPEIKKGDKRIFMINGEPVPYALARIPAPGELRGNLAAGGHGVAQSLTERDQWICAEVGHVLQKKGLYFVGLDVIGDYLTEINVTSPTCVRELDAQCGTHICGQLFDAMEVFLKKDYQKYLE